MYESPNQNKIKPTETTKLKLLFFPHKIEPNQSKKKQSRLKFKILVEKKTELREETITEIHVLSLTCVSHHDQLSLNISHIEPI